METATYVWHCTSRTIVPLIVENGLHARAWVTTHPVENMGRDQRHTALELSDDHKGECFCRVKVSSSDLAVPEEGSLTSGGLPQWRTRKQLVVGEADCECEPKTPWGTILLVGGLLFIGGFWLHRQGQHQRQA